MEECRLAAPRGDASKLLAVFPLSAEDLPAARALAGQEWGSDLMQAGSVACYVSCPEGVSKSILFKKLSASMRGGSTSRNFATLAKILELGERMQAQMQAQGAAPGKILK